MQAKEKIKFTIGGNVELSTVLLHCNFHYLAIHCDLHVRVLGKSF
jgi:hypothetical protein